MYIKPNFSKSFITLLMRMSIGTILFFLLAGNTGFKATQSAENPLYVPDELVIKLKGEVILDTENRSTNSSSLNALLGELPIKEIRPLLTFTPKNIKNMPKLDRYYKIILYNNANIPELANKIMQSPDVEFAVPNYLLQLTTNPPNDEKYNEQWALNNNATAKLNVPSAWNITTGNPVVVAVIDTGLDVTHPDLWSKNSGTGRNLINNNNDVQDYYGHGTAVSGIIGAMTNNEKGVAGMSWGAKIMPIKAGNGDDIDDAAAWNGIYWAVGHGAKIINMSFHGNDQYWASMFQEAIDTAFINGVVVVASAGNLNEDLDTNYYYPTSLNLVITVGATNKYDIRCNGVSSCQWSGASGHGTKLDVMAPGSFDIWTTDLEFGGYLGYAQGDYAQLGQTSISAPFVSGLAALMLSVNTGLGPLEVEEIIQNTAVDLGTPGKDNYYGYGRIDAYKAVRCAMGLPGDADGDCKVDGVDYFEWFDNYNRQTDRGPLDGDFNNDRKVDGIDYVIWWSNYNKW